MDPLTALGIAANVLQFVDFASKLIGKSKEVYKSASGASEDNIILDLVTRDIKRIGDLIVVPEGCPEALKKLVEESDRISQELLAALDKLRIKGHKTKWKSFVVAIRGVWSEDEVESMGARLGRLQAQITAHLQVSIGKEIAKISVAMDHLRNVDIKLGLKQAVERRAFREQLVRSVEKVIQEKLDDVHRSEMAMPQLATHISLGKVTELSATICRFHEDLRKVEGKLANATKSYDMLQTLYFHNIWARHDRIVNAHSDTFTWIFKGVCPENDKPIEYVKWLRESHDIFWIHGKPGSGKSTLMRFLIHHPDTATHLQAWAKGTRLVVGSFFFWNSGTKLQKSQEGLLRSLLFEILRQFPDLLSGVYEAIVGEWHGPQPTSMTAPSDPWLLSHSTEVSWSLQNLLKAFGHLRGREIAAKFCFFIDGLDEYRDEDNRDPRDLIKVLCNLVESPNIKLCLSSRSWTIFKDAFGRNLNTTVKLEDLTHPVYADLIEEVVRKAQGVFLWVFLVVRDLLEGLTYNDTIKIMRQRLDRFPDDLDAYFRHIFNSIHKVYRVQTARTFQIAMSREEALPLLYYSLVDEVEEDHNLAYNTSFKLGAEQIEAKLAVMWRRLEGRSKGLLEVVVSNTELKRRANSDYLVEFLHRTVRDFLLHTPDIQDELMESLQNKYQTWVLLCRVTSIVMKWREYSTVACMRQLFYFARLAVADSGDEHIVDDVLFQVFPASKLRIAQYAKSHHGVEVFDIFLASQYGLVSYVKTNLPTRLELLNDASPDDRKKEMESILGGMLRYTLIGENSYCNLSLELVEYLVSLGSSPNHLSTDNCQDTVSTVFYCFLMRIEKDEISPKESGVLEIVKTLVAHNADLGARMSMDYFKESARREKNMPTVRSRLSARDIIRKHYTADESEWIFSHAKKAPARPQHGEVKDSIALQQSDNVELQPINGPKAHHANTAVINRQNDNYPSQSHASTALGPRWSHNKQYAVRVDNVRRQAVLDDSGQVLSGLAESLGEENNVKIINVAWLGKTDVLRSQGYGSIVVYVGSSDDVSQLLSYRKFRVNGRRGTGRSTVGTFKFVRGAPIPATTTATVVQPSRSVQSVMVPIHPLVETVRNNGRLYRG
ncbi:hypothetical protein F4678DRAFT_480490 [Xylaria arbuscula]|nr:hypothetical protein F4678DRAFT_480490 [Xylaria arbuscula]